MKRRFAEIDALKAIAILTVVLIHSFRSPFDPSVALGEVWLGHLTRFAVPAFLMASGFLYAGADGSPLPLVWRRLRRIAVPYLLASVVAQIWWAAKGMKTETGWWVTDLLLCASMGPYYYVFIIIGLVFAAPIFAKFSKPTLSVATLILLVVQWWVDAATGMLMNFFWVLRNPLMWWAYFAVGWLVRANHASIVEWIAARRWAVVSALTVLVVGLSIASGIPGPRGWVRTAAWLDVYAICALIFAATAGGERVAPAVRYLSETSYPIYLLHMFYVLIAAEFIAPPFRRTELLPILLPWAAGVLGSLAVVAVLKAALGRHSRDWIGA